MKDSDEQPVSPLFQRTNPSELRRAGGGDIEALGRLATTYHRPLNIYLASAFPSLKPFAEEILQEFAEDRLLKQGWLARADLSRGRFRDFLKVSLRNYVLNWLRKKRQEERMLSLDGEGEGSLARFEAAAQEEAAVDAFDLEWFRTILSETLRRMEEDCRQPGKHQPRREQTWEIFNLRIIEPVFEDAKPPAYDELVRRFGFKKPDGRDQHASERQTDI